MSEQAIILTKDMLEKIIVISSENAAKVAITRLRKKEHIRSNDNQIKCCIIQNYY